jgi:MFS family permease
MGDADVVGGESDSTSWRAVRVATSVTILTIIPLYLVGSMSVQLREELVFGSAALGTLVGIFRAAAASSSSILGKFTDRIGAARAMRFALLIAATSTIGIATFARSWTTLAVGIVGCGVSSSWGQLAANRYLIRVVRDGRQGFAFGIKQAAMPTAAMLSGLAVPAVALTIGWRAAFVIAGVLSLMLLLFLPKPKRTWVSRSESREVRRRGAFTGSVRMLTFGLMFAMAAGSTLGAFTVETGVAQGFDVRAASLMLTLGSICSVVLRVAIGRLSDTWKGGHFEFVAGLLAVGSIGYVLLGLGSTPATIIGIPIAFGSGWAFNGLFWFAALRLDPDSPGTTAGVIMPGGMAGGVFGPILFGTIVERLGYGPAWITVACFALLAAALIRRGSRMQTAERAVRRSRDDEGSAGGTGQTGDAGDDERPEPNDRSGP